PDSGPPWRIPIGLDQRAVELVLALTRGRLSTEPLVGEHCRERASIPTSRSCPGRVARPPVALVGCRAGRAVIHWVVAGCPQARKWLHHRTDRGAIDDL